MGYSRAHEFGVGEAGRSFQPESAKELCKSEKDLTISTQIHGLHGAFGMHGVALCGVEIDPVISVQRVLVLPWMRWRQGG